MKFSQTPLPSRPSMATRQELHPEESASSKGGPPLTSHSRRRFITEQAGQPSYKSVLFHIGEGEQDDDDDNMSAYDYSVVDNRSYVHRPNLATAFGLDDDAPDDDQSVGMVSAAFTLDDDSVYICSVRSVKKKVKKTKNVVRQQPQEVNAFAPVPEISFLDDSFAFDDNTSCLHSLGGIMKEMYDTEAEVPLEEGADLCRSLRKVDDEHVVGASSDESSYGESSAGTKSTTAPSSQNSLMTEAALVQMMADCNKQSKKGSWVRRWTPFKSFKPLRLTRATDSAPSASKKKLTKKAVASSKQAPAAPSTTKKQVQANAPFQDRSHSSMNFSAHTTATANTICCTHEVEC